MTTSEYLKEAMSLFAIVDPVGSIAIFLSLTINQTDRQKIRTAIVASLSVALVLTVATLVGDWVLWFFGISIWSFKVGGGILIFLISISMLNARHPGFKRTEEEIKEAEDSDTVAVVPLAIPLMAGPGAISSAIIHAHNSVGLAENLLHISIVLFISAITLAVLLAGVRIAGRLGATGINIIMRIMGLLLAAISVEIIADGIKGIFPGLA